MSRRSPALGITLASGVALLGLAIAATQVAERRFRVVMNNEPITGYVRWATEAARGNQSRFLILMVGTSLTHYAADPTLIERRLEAPGRSVKVLRIVAGGMSVFEQWEYLREFVELGGTVPNLVLFERTQGYDDAPLESLLRTDSARLVARAMTSARPSAVPWGLKWIASSRLSWTERAKRVAVLVGYAAVRAAGIGLLWKGALFDDIAPVVVPPPNLPAAPVSDADIESLADRTIAGAMNWNEVPGSRSEWALAYVRRMLRDTRRLGVPHVGVYAIPALTAQRAAYARWLCERIGDVPCLSQAEPEFLARFRSGSFWYDRGSHLAQPGREVVSDRIARWILEAGFLDGRDGPMRARSFVR